MPTDNIDVNAAARVDRDHAAIGAQRCILTSRDGGSENTLAAERMPVLRQIASSHICLSHQYGCRAYMTVVTFVFAGIVHRARRFFREDLARSTGRIELYTIEPYPGERATHCTQLAWYASTANEDFLGYARPNASEQCCRDRIATVLLDAAVTGNALSMESDERFAALEMV